MIDQNLKNLFDDGTILTFIEEIEQIKTNIEKPIKIKFVELEMRIEELNNQ